MKQLRRNLSRYWGFVALAIIVGGWVTDKTIPTVSLVLSVAAVGYFLFRAPLWCGSVIRDGRLCRNNSQGLVIGCHLRQHKWQKLKMIAVPKMWGELNRGLWDSPRQGVATLAALASVVAVGANLVG